jgi:hypothetical protein
MRENNVDLIARFSKSTNTLRLQKMKQLIIDMPSLIEQLMPLLSLPPTQSILQLLPLNSQFLEQHRHFRLSLDSILLPSFNGLLYHLQILIQLSSEVVFQQKFIERRGLELLLQLYWNGVGASERYSAENSPVSRNSPNQFTQLHFNMEVALSQLVLLYVKRQDQGVNQIVIGRAFEQMA